jgi:hypothetical protein
VRPGATLILVKFWADAGWLPLSQFDRSCEHGLARHLRMYSPTGEPNNVYGRRVLLSGPAGVAAGATLGFGAGAISNAAA